MPVFQKESWRKREQAEGADVPLLDSRLRFSHRKLVVTLTWDSSETCKHESFRVWQFNFNLSLLLSVQLKHKKGQRGWQLEKLLNQKDQREKKTDWWSALQYGGRCSVKNKGTTHFLHFYSGHQADHQWTTYFQTYATQRTVSQSDFMDNPVSS